MELLTTRQAAEHLGMSYQAFCKATQRRNVEPSMVIGTSYLWAERQLNQLKRPQ